MRAPGEASPTRLAQYTKAVRLAPGLRRTAPSEGRVLAMYACEQDQRQRRQRDSAARCREAGRDQMPKCSRREPTDA